MEKVVDMERITKLLGMTLSSNKNESLNAISLLSKYLQENDLVWGDVFRFTQSSTQSSTQLNNENNDRNNDKKVKDCEIRIQEQEKIMDDYRR